MSSMKNGCPVKTPLDDRVNGMTMVEQALTDRVIALAGGRANADAIRNAMMTRAVGVLITAERLREPGPNQNGSPLEV